MKLQTFTTIFCLTTLIGGITNLLPNSALASSEAACEVAIANAKKRIVEGRTITIVQTDITDNSKLYPDHPNGRPLFINIALKGSATVSVMKSPVFQTAIASELIKSCTSVGAVAFGKYQTDWRSIIGLMPDGTIQQFQKCVNPSRESNYPSWGQAGCP